MASSDFVTLNEILSQIHSEQEKTSARAEKSISRNSRSVVRLNPNVLQSSPNEIDFKEMRKTINQANRRFAEIEKRGMVSSAVKQVISQFGGKFPSAKDYNKISPLAWEQLKDVYARAVSFMYNPTSTVTGAKKYIRKIAKKLHTSETNASRLIDIATNPEIMSDGLISVFRYREMLEAFSEYMGEMRDKLEMSDEQYAEYVENNMNRAFNEFVQQAEESATKDIKNYLKSSGRLNYNIPINVSARK